MDDHEAALRSAAPSRVQRPAPAVLDREVALFFKSFLRAMRDRTDPDRLGVPTYGRRLTRRGVTQAEIALFMGISEAWYRRLENSTLDAHWTEELANAFADAVAMAPLERKVLYALALGRAPYPPPVKGEVNEETRTTLDRWPAPAYLSDELWFVRYRNARMAHSNPDLKPGANVMTWVLTTQHAREWLVEYDEAWVRPMFAQLRTAWMCAQGPTKQELRQIIDHARAANKLVAKLWETDRTLYEEPSGDVRRINPPLEPEQTIRLWGAAPLGHPAWRIIFLEPYSAPTQNGQVPDAYSPA